MPMNVFDKIEDFYGQDEGWDEVIPRRHIEGYLRARAFEGADDARLNRLWDYLSMLCLYIGNSELQPGDLNRDDFVDCVGWSARNIAGFPLTAAGVAAYLEVLEDFYGYLQEKRFVTANRGAREARERLLAGGALQIFDREGNYLPAAKKTTEGVPDLAARVFFGMGERVDAVLAAMRLAFGSGEFSRDVERARSLYGSFLPEDARLDAPGSGEYEHCFWDYFLFDYCLMADGRRPVEFFRDHIRSSAPREAELQALENHFMLCAILDELAQARLVFFGVKRHLGEDDYECEDFFTGELYLLTLTLEEAARQQQMLFMGHIYYGESMVVDFVRGVRFEREGMNNFRTTVVRARAWQAVRFGGKEPEMRDFIAANPVFMRNAAILYAAYRYPVRFNELTGVRGYAAAPLCEDREDEALADLMRSASFGREDRRLARQLWADFKAACGEEISSLPGSAESRAAAVLRKFVEISGAYSCDWRRVFAAADGVREDEVRQLLRLLEERLRLEPHDPRYLNEEGMLLRLLADK